MLIKAQNHCLEIDSPDGCKLRELLHPKQDPIALGFSLASARLGPGERTHAHVLTQVEVYHILEGEGRMHIAAESGPVGPGDSVYIPAGAVQWIENVGPGELRFLAMVCPPWQAEDDRLA